MRIALSASRTWRELESASEYTAIVRMPSRRQVRAMRQAISPRLAIKMDSNILGYIRKTGEGPATGASAADRARQRPMTSRVSDGSMIPSSQSRAVA